MRIEFARPDLLYLLALLPVWALIVWPRSGRGAPYTRGASPDRPRFVRSVRAALLLLAPRALTATTLSVIVVALAGPQRVEVIQRTELEGHGMGIVVDLSSSMLAEDMGESLDRISVARDAAIRFARRRVHDELSLVGFGSNALTRVPPTRDRELIVHGVESLETQLVRDGTDISGAVLAAMARLMDSEREPRVIVLLTDGAHNGTEMPPLTTARAAEALGVRIHTISVLAPSGSRAGDIIQERFAEERETVLQSLAGITGGSYFKASGPVSLDSIYEQIDRLEMPTPRVVEEELRHPLATWIFMLGLVLLVAEALLRGSRWGLVH